jgi:hypothetical protein
MKKIHLSRHVNRINISVNPNIIVFLLFAVAIIGILMNFMVFIIAMLVAVFALHNDMEVRELTQQQNFMFYCILFIQVGCIISTKSLITALDILDMKDSS